MKVASFDIFDTCLVRACGSHFNVFDILARRVLGEDTEDARLVDFATIRIDGESMARKASATQEISFDDIYKCCDFSALTDLSNKEIADMELLVEEDLLVSVFSIKELISKQRNKGHLILFISDMYLPTSFLKKILEKNEVFNTGDKIYVSGEYGISKSTGDLYKLIAKENDLEYKDWTHYGDNRYSDYKVPKRLGINAKLIEHKNSFYEERIFSQSYFPSFFVNEILAGISKAVRLNFPEDIRNTFATDLISPLYISFVIEILNDAKQNGIRKIIFLARDGQILYDIAKCFKPLFPDLQFKYIYVSRTSLYFPGLKEISVESLKSIIKYDLKSSNIINTLSRLIDPDVVEKINQLDPSLHDISNQNEALARLLNNNEIKKILIQYHATQREYIMQYFTQEGMTSYSNDIACVDIRGSRRCQIALNNILEQYGYNRIKAYYLSTTKDRIPYSHDDPYYSVFFDNKYKSRKYLKPISTIGNALEEYYSASNDRRTIYYKETEEKTIEPAFSSEVSDYKNKIYNINKTIIEKCISYFIKTQLYKDNDYVKLLALIINAEFATKPYYKYLSPLYHTKQGNVRIINYLTPKNCINRNMYWIIGSLVFTFKTNKILKLKTIGKYLKSQFKYLK